MHFKINQLKVFISMILACFLLSQPLAAQNFYSVIPSYLFADTLINRHSVWFDLNDDAQFDLIKANIYNKKNKVFKFNQADYELSNTAINQTGGNSNGFAAADIDRDGDIDLFQYSIFGQKNAVFINQGIGLFEKSYQHENICIENNAFHASFCDVDNDGDPDLLITDTELWNPKQISKQCKLFYNDGIGNFKEKYPKQFNNPQSDTRAVAWADIDGDADQDLLMVNFGSPNQLYINDGKGQFSFKSSVFSYLKDDSNDAGFGDIDNDGDDDLIIANLKYAPVLYLNEGHQNFVMAPIKFTQHQVLPGSVSIVDANNDGSLDIYSNAMGTNQHQLMLQNKNDKHWVNIKLRQDGKNFFAIGARVAIKCIINQQAVWQSKEIRTKTGRAHINNYDLHFGLGDASQIDSLVITWTDGRTETKTNLSIDQIYLIEQQSQVYSITATVLANHKETAIKDLSIRMIADSMKLGEVFSTTLFYENKSVIPQDITVELELNPYCKLLNAFPNAIQTQDNRVKWVVKNVAPLQNGYILVSSLFSKDPESILVPQTLKVSIFPLVGDENKSNNSYEVRQRIVWEP